MNEAAKATLSKVPEVTLGFWIIKIIATTIGETGGDAVTMSLFHADKDAHNGGYLIGTGIFMGVFVAAVIAQIAMKKFHPVDLLADDRGDHDGRHDNGRFRRSFARNRLRGRIIAPACPAPDVAARLALAGRDGLGEYGHDAPGRGLLLDHHSLLRRRSAPRSGTGWPIRTVSASKTQPWCSGPVCWSSRRRITSPACHGCSCSGPPSS